jgi:catechol 2,3-dioxygenase-like lactoylglutathione lyase family enzyme
MTARRVTKVFPIFAVADLEAAMRYYRDELGFTVAWKWGDPPQRAGVVLDDIEFQLVAPGPGIPPGPALVYCHMTGLDGYYAECRARGAEIALELGDRPWGARDFRIVDPDGNRIGFAEVTGAG